MKDHNMLSWLWSLSCVSITRWRYCFMVMCRRATRALSAPSWRTFFALPGELPSPRAWVVWDAELDCIRQQSRAQKQTRHVDTYDPIIFRLSMKGFPAASWLSSFSSDRYLSQSQMIVNCKVSLQIIVGSLWKMITLKSQRAHIGGAYDS